MNALTSADAVGRRWYIRWIPGHTVGNIEVGRDRRSLCTRLRSIEREKSTGGFFTFAHRMVVKGYTVRNPTVPEPGTAMATASDAAEAQTRA